MWLHFSITLPRKQLGGEESLPRAKLVQDPRVHWHEVGREWFVAGVAESLEMELWAKKNGSFCF